MATQNPLDRLSEFPNMMNWRGTWLATEQYLQNDVVVSPVNTASYILIVSSILDGADPSINPDWRELAPAVTGITQIDAGAGITVTDPTGPIVTIENDGVITLISGANIDVDNTDPKNPIVNSTALSGVTAGHGISVSGLSFSPTITNIGVRTLTVGPGLLSNLDPNNPSITTSAVLSITQGNGILVTGGQAATVTNNGVVSITSTGGGINVNNADPRNPIISNTGVQSVTAGENIVIGGTSINPIVSALIPASTLVSSSSGTVPQGGTFPIAPAGLGELVITPVVTDIFYDYINGGAPEATGIFVLDLTSINLFLSGSTPVAAGDKITVVLLDINTTAPTPIVYALGDIEMNPTANSYPFQIRPSQYAFNVTSLRASGFRIPYEIGFLNSTTAATIELNSWGDIYATYYPNGLN